ncbi:MAG TPA: dienelactone hydrolase family protein [Blastocatellia bacterium]|nr:dienelactone hydrolase family protein [Blastocatellia bacterium]
MAQGEDVTFDHHGTATAAYLARPSGAGNGRTVIVVQEWWGLNEHVKDIARRYADEGFVALAPDLYAGRIAADAKEASALMHALAPETGVAVLKSAVDYLEHVTGVDPARIGITGYCMGGSFALLFACRDSRIKAAAPFYGDIPSDADLAHLGAPVLFIGAEKDGWITPAKIHGLAASLAKLGKPCEIKIYEGADHAFFNDTRPEVYDPAAAADAWKRVTSMFQENL